MNIHFKNQKLKKIYAKALYWMNETEVVSLRGKNFRIKPGRVIALAAGLTAAFLLLLAIVGMMTGDVRSVNISIEGGSDYTAKEYNGDVLLYNKQHIMAIDKKGKLLWKTDVAMSQPVVETAGKYFLAYDLDGANYATLYKKDTLVREFSLGNDIISAKLTKNGYTAFATDTIGYKGNVKVFDKKGRERFSWNSGDGYILDIALKKNARQLAVAQLMTNEEKASTCVQFIDIIGKKVVGSGTCSDTVFTELSYRGGKLTAISDNGLYCFSSSGRVVYNVSLAGKTPQLYDISADGMAVFSVLDSRGNTALEFYSTNGKLKGSYKSESRINTFAAYDFGAAAAKRSDVQIISSKGKLKKTITAVDDIKSAEVFDNGKFAIVIGDDEAVIVKLK